MNTNLALKKSFFASIDLGDNTSLDIDDIPCVEFYRKVSEGGTTFFKHAGSYPAPDEEYWLKQHESHGDVILVLPFYEGDMVDSDGNPFP